VSRGGDEDRREDGHLYDWIFGGPHQWYGVGVIFIIHYMATARTGIWEFRAFGALEIAADEI